MFLEMSTKRGREKCNECCVSNGTERGKMMEKVEVLKNLVCVDCKEWRKNESWSG